MVDRISSNSRYAQLVADMKMNQFNFNKLTQQLSSGKKVVDLTDDPIASINILNTNKQLGQIETFEQNVGMASAELSALDDLLALANGYLSEAWDKAIQANNQTYTEGSLKALKVEIDEITKTMVDLANTQYNDNYIFSGANTKTVTYTIDKDGNIIYNGTPQTNPDYIRKTEVADGVFEVINTTGDKIFGYYEKVQEKVGDKFVYLDENNKRVLETVDPVTKAKTYTYEDNGADYPGKFEDLSKVYTEEEKYSGVLGALKKLSNGIEKVLNGDEADGYDEMRATLDLFDKSLNTITTEQTKFGGVANRLEMTTSTLETNNENLSAYLSQVQDIDYASAITQWMNAQYAYQASMQIASASMNMSLLNYIQ
ncbi:flagellar hook-associated protein FlgL [bacterium]|nr:flagellar hook-associated protein FlgL [bacterium]